MKLEDRRTLAFIKECQTQRIVMVPSINPERTFLISRLDEAEAELTKVKGQRDRLAHVLRCIRDDHMLPHLQRRHPAGTTKRCIEALSELGKET